MTETEAAARRSARVILVDEEQRVLLFQTSRQRDDPASGRFWFTPGGRVEPGESLAEAAARELREETGLVVTPDALGPVVCRASGEARLRGFTDPCADDYFLLRVPTTTALPLGDDAGELATHTDRRWWPLAELAATDETIVPIGLAALVADLLAGDVPARPRVMPWHV